MTCEEAFKILSPYLWEIEKREIFEYKTIYFFNIEERKSPPNFVLLPETEILWDYGDSYINYHD
jgi:hypothetical protein